MPKPMTDERLCELELLASKYHCDYCAVNLDLEEAVKEVRRLREENIPTCRKLHFPIPDDWELSRGPMCPDCYDILKARNGKLRKENEQLKEEIKGGWERAAEINDVWMQQARELLGHTVDQIGNGAAGVAGETLRVEIRAFLDGEKNE